MSQEVLKSLVFSAVAVIIFAGIMVLILKSVRVLKTRKARGAEKREELIDRHPFAVEREILYVHTQERLDDRDL